MPGVNYHKEFETLLSPHRAAGTSVSAAELFSLPQLGTASSKTKRGHLKKFLDSDITYLGTVQGILPSVDVVIELAAKHLGAPVSEGNVVEANRACAAIVTKAAGPVVEEFVRSGLGPYISEDSLQISVHELMEFLVGEFAAFTKGAGNGLVSVAGALNERLLVRCLLEKGLKKDEDFRQTGTESEGDVVIHTKVAAKTNLGVEIKSYHARERLLRGLRDIDRPKVGAGYFVDPSEFNPQRTILLLQTNAAAIYMPAETLAKLDSKAAGMTTNDTIAFGFRFYRPIERFASDMEHFVQAGNLPPA